MTVVYSAIYGGIEAPKVQPDLGCRMVMFTDDRHLEAPGWEVRHEPLPNVDGPMMRSRYWKYHSGEVGDRAVPVRTHCPASHEYTPENTWSPPGTSYQKCRTCHRERERERRRQAKEAA